MINPQIIQLICGLYYKSAHYTINPRIIHVIRRLYDIIRQSDYNVHDHQLLALHQVRSFKRKTNKITKSIIHAIWQPVKFYSVLNGIWKKTFHDKINTRVHLHLKLDSSSPCCFHPQLFHHIQVQHK